jgi:hypothetical protein
MPRYSDSTKPRRAKFIVLGLFLDGQRSATLTIETGGYLRGRVLVRPHRAQREYVLPLGLACEVIAARAAKLGPPGIITAKEKES